MKSYPFFLFIIALFFFSSCKNDNRQDVGFATQPEKDKIVVHSDTFHLKSESFFPKKIYNRSDSLVLGHFDDKKYGEVIADILTQFDMPFEPNYKYPENAEFDSIVLFLSYKSWFGAANSPIQINVYEINKDEALDYNTFYPSDIDPEKYVDMTKSDALVGETVLTAKQSNTQTQNLIKINLSEEFGKKLFAHSKTFESRLDFLTKFKGFFITTGFGDATMLNIQDLELRLFYHFPKDEKGTIVNVSNKATFPSNSLITKVNRFQHPKANEIETFLQEAKNKKINYLSVPANIYSKVNLPLRKMVTDMQNSVGEKELIINQAQLIVHGLDIDTSAFSIQPPQCIILIEEAKVNDFFKRPSLDKLNYGLYKKKDSCYTINLTKLLNQKIIKAKKEGGPAEIKEELNMVLMPARLLINEKEAIVGVKPEIRLRGITIRSGSDLENPMKLNLLYSGF